MMHLPDALKLSDPLPWVWHTSDCSIHYRHNCPIDNWYNDRKLLFIILRPVPWDGLSNVVAHLLPCIIRIDIGDGKFVQLNKKIGQCITMLRYEQWPVTWGFWLIVLCRYTSSSRAIEASGWWITYQSGQNFTSGSELHWFYCTFHKGQPPQAGVALPWCTDYQGFSCLPSSVSKAYIEKLDHWFE